MWSDAFIGDHQPHVVSGNARLLEIERFRKSVDGGGMNLSIKEGSSLPRRLGCGPGSIPRPGRSIPSEWPSVLQPEEL